MVPVVSPIFWIRINGTEPITAVLEARKPSDLNERKAVDAEPVIPTIVTAIIVIRNAIAAVPATLLPRAVLRFPTVGAALVPGSPLLVFLRTLLFVRAL